MNKYFMKKIGLPAAAALAAGSQAIQVQAADWTTVTTAVDFSGEITAIQAIVGVLAGVLVVMVGGRKVLGMLKA